MNFETSLISAGDKKIRPPPPSDAKDRAHVRV